MDRKGHGRVKTAHFQEGQRTRGVTTALFRKVPDPFRDYTNSRSIPRFLNSSGLRFLYLSYFQWQSKR